MYICTLIYKYIFASEKKKRAILTLLPSLISSISSVQLLISLRLHSGLELLILIFPVKVDHPGRWTHFFILLPELSALLHLLVLAAPELIPGTPVCSSLRLLHQLFLPLWFRHPVTRIRYHFNSYIQSTWRIWNTCDGLYNSYIKFDLLKSSKGALKIFLKKIV